MFAFYVGMSENSSMKFWIALNFVASLWASPAVDAYFDQFSVFRERENWKENVLFNLGAAEADAPQGDLKTAEAAYKEAAVLFQCPLDGQRCAIRLGKIFLLRGDIESAHSILEEILPDIRNERIGVHASYLAAQIEHADRNIEKAKSLGVAALETARRLGAKKDAERVSLFLEGLE